MKTSFNGLTPAQAERLALIAEEAGEVVQAVGKILRHGYDSRHPNGGPDNRQQLETEIGHFIAATGILHAEGDIRETALSEATVLKVKTVAKYLHHNAPGPKPKKP